jgi:16S rRNA G966 N2-methylase RsmD
MYSGKENLKFYLDNLFEHVELAQKEVLDVGGGRGLLTFYTAVKGAKKAVCLEPEKEGSKKGAFYYKLDKRRYDSQFHAFLNFIPNPDNLK